MKLSEFIKALKVLEEKYGDAEVNVNARTDLEGGVWCNIDDADDISYDADDNSITINAYEPEHFHSDLPF